LLSSQSVEWSTPLDLFAELNARYAPFTLDAAATPENAKCDAYYTLVEDGLAQTWTGKVWLNPPYGRNRIGRWMRKAWESSQTTAELVVCLVPARTGPDWWHEWAMRGEVEFLRGRQRFGDSKNAAPFDSAIVVFRKDASLTKLRNGVPQT
jgi:phage N-6-adenine-methyltransferase